MGTYINRGEERGREVRGEERGREEGGNERSGQGEGKERMINKKVKGKFETEHFAMCVSSANMCM